WPSTIPKGNKGLRQENHLPATWPHIDWKSWRPHGRQLGRQLFSRKIRSYVKKKPLAGHVAANSGHPAGTWAMQFVPQVLCYFFFSGSGGWVKRRWASRNSGGPWN